MFIVTAITDKGRRWVIGERESQQAAQKSIESMRLWLRIYCGEAVVGFSIDEKKETV